MINRIRAVISEKIFQVFRRNNAYFELQTKLSGQASKKQQSVGTYLQWTIPFDLDPNNVNVRALKENVSDILDVRITPVRAKCKRQIEFQIKPDAYLRSLLFPYPVENVEDYENYYNNDKHIVVEFSSPNIAKPFHVGHLRSTLIGNVLGNLHQRVGHQVTKINFLGDWGTQFGMLQIGVEIIGATSEEIERDPIGKLHQAYIAANDAAKFDKNIIKKARQSFTALETFSNTEIARQWQKYRKYTILELEKLYSRLGVHFDRYEWESQYSKHEISSILEQLRQKSLLHEEMDGRHVVEVDERRIPIIKSDGTTLYLARDIAALVDRFYRFKFSRILYVVENGQTDHFNACFKTSSALCEDIKLEKLMHVKFGRIHGMSTRKGSVVFLKDVLDKARDIMFEKQLKSSTTKVDLFATDIYSKNVADILGVSAVIINDLKQRRQRDYKFDWDKALQVNGDSGIKLQYTHCRLNNLLENMTYLNVDDFKPSYKYFMEPEAQSLLNTLAHYENALWLATEQLEACVLVNYLFGLCNITSRALKTLNLKNEPCLEKKKHLYFLFRAVKLALKEGIEILGLIPLNKM